MLHENDSRAGHPDWTDNDVYTGEPREPLPPIQPVTNHLLTVQQAADWLNVSRSHLYELPIRYVKIGKARRYDPQDLQAYVDLNGNRKPILRRGAA